MRCTVGDIYSINRSCTYSGSGRLWDDSSCNSIHSNPFPVVFEERLFGASRAEVFDKLAENGIGARKYFYPLTNTFECFHGKYDVTKTPVALHISKRVLTLPLYADLALDDVDRICGIILNCKY